MIEILHRYTKAVLYKSNSAEAVGEAVKEAITTGSDLRYSDLSGSDLRYSDLRYSDLSGSNLRGSNLSGSNLRGSNLSGSNLSGSDLSYSDLSGSNLSYSDLSGSNLSGSNLRGSNLSGAKDIPSIAAAQTTVAMPEGLIVGWKKCSGGVIVKLHIPPEARRSNATGRKCRAEFADVVEVIGDTVGISMHDNKTQYVVGARVTCHEWCEDRWNECAGGIHFFITKEEACVY